MRKFVTVNDTMQNEGTQPEINLADGIRFKGSSGNYSDMRVHVDDVEEFIKRVRNYYGS